MHVLEYFQQIYVINLPHRSDRRREMAEQLKNIGLGFHSPEVRLFEAIRSEEPGGFSSAGARGCFLSHMGVLYDAHKQGFDRILILEDDVNFAPDFNLRMPLVVAALKDMDWSVFYGGFEMERLPQSEGDEVVLQVGAADSIQNAHFIAFRGAAIGETANFLETLLSRPQGDPRGGPMHVDGAYCWFRSQNPSKITLLAVSQLGYQRSSRTDIHALRWFDRVPGIRQAVGVVRKVRNRSRR